MDVNEDAQRLLVEVNQLEEELAKDGRNLAKIIKMTELYLRLARPEKAITYLNQSFCIFQTQHDDISTLLGLELVDVAIRYWKFCRYENKTKINCSLERFNILSDIWNVLLQLSKDTQLKIGSTNGVESEGNETNVSNSQIISVKMAYIKECLGNNSDSLAVLSDLIAAHAIEAVDLSYIIFKASIILKHIGQNKQSIEYLEFLLDDPPLQEGYSKLHVIAFLILLYEQSGDKYKVFLHKTYKDLKAAYSEDLTNKKVSTANNLKKLNDIIKSPSLATSSEIWEILAMQAMEKCEYIMALELLQQAVIKAPTKGKLFLIIAEIYNLLKKPEPALKNCEKAAALIPSNVECRDLLLVLNPDKYTEKMRTATVVNVALKNKESVGNDEFDEGGETTVPSGSAGAGGGVNAKESGGEGSEGWMDKVKNKATGTLKAMHDNGVAATILSPIIQTNNPTSSSTSSTVNPKSSSTVSSSTSQSGPKKKTSSASSGPGKKGAVTRGKEVHHKTVVARPVSQPVEEEQIEIVNAFRPRKPVIDEEAQRMLKLILNGNQNVHFYDISMRQLAEVRAEHSMMDKDM